MSQMAALKSMDLLSDAHDLTEESTQMPFNKLKNNNKVKKTALKSPLKSKFMYG